MTPRFQLISALVAMLLFATACNVFGRTDAVGPTCEDGKTNGDETDLDCGGECDPCTENLACRIDEDCENDSCINRTCSLADRCKDNVQNVDESDIDCGGNTCERCSDGLRCRDDADCLSAICDEGRCADEVVESCENETKDVDETDVDCGGPCRRCFEDEKCTQDNDCEPPLVCDIDVCQVASQPLKYKIEFELAPRTTTVAVLIKLPSTVLDIGVWGRFFADDEGVVLRSADETESMFWVRVPPEVTSVWFHFDPELRYVDDTGSPFDPSTEVAWLMTDGTDRNGGEISFDSTLFQIVDSPLGSAIQLDGTIGSVVDDDGRLSEVMSRSFTVSFWGRINADAGYQTILSRRLDEVGSAQLVWFGHHINHWESARANEAGDPWVLTPSDQFPPGTWVHSVTTFDGSMLRLYVDGNLLESRPIEPSPTVASFPFIVGAVLNGATFLQQFTGSVDDLRIYSDVMNEASIREHFLSGQGDLVTGVGEVISP